MLENGDSVGWWASLVGLLAGLLGIGGWGVRSIARETARQVISDVEAKVTANTAAISEHKIDFEKRMGAVATHQAELKSDVHYIKEQLEDVRDKLDLLIQSRGKG